MRDHRFVVMAFGLVLVLAAVLRLHGIDFGLPALNDPDELMFELGATRMLTGPSLNPGWFGHPAATTMDLLAVVNAATFGFGWLAGSWADPEAFIAAIYPNPGLVILPGRIAMAVFGLLTIWQVWRLGRQLDGPVDGQVTGLFAALLLACSPVHVTYSQIIRSDMMGTFFMLMCMGAALRIAREGRQVDFRWAALWLALAVASKWPFAIAGLAVAGAVLHRLLLEGSNRRELLLRLGGFCLLAPLLLVVISPYLVLDFDTVQRNLFGEAQTQHLGATGDGLFGNARWYLQGALLRGLGVAGLALATAGLALVLRDREKALVLLPVLLMQALIICLHGLRWERWALPLLPILALTAGLAAARLMQLVKERRGASWGWASGMAVLIVPLALVQPAWRDAAARTNDTRQVATQWAENHIPPGSVVLVEHFAFDLMQHPWTVLFPLGDAGCVNARDMLAGRVDLAVVDQARSGRSNVDYGTLAPDMRDTCRADFAILMEMERYRVEQARFPQQHASYQSLLEDMEVRTIIRPEQGVRAGPAVTVLAARPER